jgi:hypothetical protein
MAGGSRRSIPGERGSDGQGTLPVLQAQRLRGYRGGGIKARRDPNELAALHQSPDHGRRAACPGKLGGGDEPD